MKTLFRNLIVNILSYESRKILKKFRPYVISITGNVGKTTTKDYIAHFLESKFNTEISEDVRASKKSENSEFGVNLTILGEENAWGNVFRWFGIILRNYFKILFGKKYPKILVLEIGADKPGDISYITSIIKSDMVVLTAFQESPSHGEFFLNIEQHILEKRVLVDRMKKNGIIVYNSDDKVMTNMAHAKRSEDHTIKIYSYGYNSTNVNIVEVTNLYDEDALIVGTKAKFDINLDHNNFDLELRLYGVVGAAHVYSLASAVTVALLSGFQKEEIINAVETLVQDGVVSKSRMRLLKGVNQISIIDDTYNSSPKAAINAIETVSQILVKGKKIGIFGHMAELGEKTRQEHFNVGYRASSVFDILIFSGRHNEYYLEGVREGRFDLDKVYLCSDGLDVLYTLYENDLISTNDLLLVKGSQSARMEKVVVGLLENEEDQEFVCRQEVEWIKR